MNNTNQFLIFFFQTQARFLSDHSNPTADSLSSFQEAETSEHTAIPLVEAEDAENEKETATSIEDHSHHKVKGIQVY